MRKDPVTQKRFEPKHLDHVFQSSESFDKFVEQKDVMDEFNVTKRDIGWEPKEVECPRCDKTFMKTHPATIYCEECRPKESTSS